MVRLLENKYASLTDKMSEIQRYYIRNAKQKAILKNVKFNGESATVKFLEYEAPEKDILLFQEEDGTDGHFFYIVVSVRYFDNYWEAMRTTVYDFITDKETGNQIYKDIKRTGEFNYTF